MKNSVHPNPLKSDFVVRRFIELSHDRAVAFPCEIYLRQSTRAIVPCLNIRLQSIRVGGLFTHRLCQTGGSWSGRISSAIQSRGDVDSPERGQQSPGFGIPPGGFDFEKSHQDDGRAIIIDRNCVWKRVPRARPRALDYKRYCGIVTGDGRGRAVDRTVDRLIIALYSRTKPPDIFASLFRRYLFIFSTGDRPPPPTRLPLASHLPAGIAQPAIRPGSNLTITFPLRRLSGLFFPFYRFLVRFFRSPSCYLHKVPVEITHSPGSFRQKN